MDAISGNLREISDQVTTLNQLMADEREKNANIDGQMQVLVGEMTGIADEQKTVTKKAASIEK